MSKSYQAFLELKLTIACLSGYMNVAIKAVEDGATDFQSAFYYAVKGGRLEMIQWLVEDKHFEMPEDTIYVAIKANRLTVLKWLVEEKGVEIPENAISKALKDDSFTVVKWLVEEKGIKIPLVDEDGIKIPKDLVKMLLMLTK